MQDGCRHSWGVVSWIHREWTCPVTVKSLRNLAVCTFAELLWPGAERPGDRRNPDPRSTCKPKTLLPGIFTDWCSAEPRIRPVWGGGVEAAVEDLWVCLWMVTFRVNELLWVLLVCYCHWISVAVLKLCAMLYPFLRFARNPESLFPIFQRLRFLGGRLYFWFAAAHQS